MKNDNREYKMKGLLITFTGIDGSGKSTLSSTLAESLEKEKIETRYLWWFSAENSLIRRAIRLVAGKKKIASGIGEGKLPKSSLVQKLYQYIVLLDYQRQTIFKVWLPLVLGKSVVCDRYVYDVVISFAKEFSYPEDKTKNMISTLLGLSPKPDIAFLVDVPVKVAVQRKNDIPSPQRHEQLRKMYNDLITDDLTVLDGTLSIDELNNIIWDRVQNHLKTSGAKKSEKSPIHRH